MTTPPGRHAAGHPDRVPGGHAQQPGQQYGPAEQWVERQWAEQQRRAGGAWPDEPRGDLAAEPWTDHTWVDQDAGPVVRPYAMTGGRVHPASGSFDVVAMVVANRAAVAGHGYGLQPEHRAILAYAREPLAVAELASHLDLALGVVRVLLGDLLGQGLIEMYHPAVAGELPSESILKAVINGLRAL
ncbi:DUF742 domain-containing protein [Dactylosporangium aurantiacum]|uniref:DUF742 domain-containing protein n=1 Tax=Dactylosporangium aurantiacum TaxID=35754 RepID=A0A9Q9IAC5_9ACTN|nr:DUF742 domain-containing protein [Dactylosporangium aurantiacum]